MTQAPTFQPFAFGYPQVVVGSRLLVQSRYATSSTPIEIEVLGWSTTYRHVRVRYASSGRIEWVNPEDWKWEVVDILAPARTAAGTVLPDDMQGRLDNLGAAVQLHEELSGDMMKQISERLAESGKTPEAVVTQLREALGAAATKLRELGYEESVHAPFDGGPDVRRWVPKDGKDPTRWETGIRNICTILLSASAPFEVSDLVDIIRIIVGANGNGDPISKRSLAHKLHRMAARGDSTSVLNAMRANPAAYRWTRP